MKYSNKELTDDNFDDEIETLRELFSDLNSGDYEIYKTLPSGFEEHMATDDDGNQMGFMMWIRSGGITHDHSSSVFQVHSRGEFAFEFSNCFLSLHFIEAL